MPTYEYRCAKCKRKHEVSQSITAKPLTRCPRPGCGGKLARLMGTGGTILFKGSGFYITDYRKKSYHDAKQKDQAGSKPSAPASEKGPAAEKSASPGTTDGKK